MLGKNDTNPSVRMIYTNKNYGHKKASISIEGESFARVPVSINLTLEDEDSPNSAGVIVDAIRISKLLTDCGLQEKTIDVSSLLMKAPPEQCSEEEALSNFNRTVELCMSKIAEEK